MKRKVICHQLELRKQLADVSTECSSRHQCKSEETLMMTGAFSQNISKLFSELKLVTDNTFSYAEAN